MSLNDEKVVISAQIRDINQEKRVGFFGETMSRVVKVGELEAAVVTTGPIGQSNISPATLVVDSALENMSDAQKDFISITETQTLGLRNSSTRLGAPGDLADLEVVGAAEKKQNKGVGEMEGGVGIVADLESVGRIGDTSGGLPVVVPEVLAGLETAETVAENQEDGRKRGFRAVGVSGVVGMDDGISVFQSGLPSSRKEAPGAPSVLGKGKGGRKKQDAGARRSGSKVAAEGGFGAGVADLAGLAVAAAPITLALPGACLAQEVGEVIGVIGRMGSGDGSGSGSGVSPILGSHVFDGGIGGVGSLEGGPMELGSTPHGGDTSSGIESAGPLSGGPLSLPNVGSRAGLNDLGPGVVVLPNVPSSLGGAGCGVGPLVGSPVLAGMMGGPLGASPILLSHVFDGGVGGVGSLKGGPMELTPHGGDTSSGVGAGPLSGGPLSLPNAGSRAGLSDLGPGGVVLPNVPSSPGGAGCGVGPLVGSPVLVELTRGPLAFSGHFRDGGLAEGSGVCDGGGAGVGGGRAGGGSSRTVPPSVLGVGKSSVGSGAGPSGLGPGEVVLPFVPSSPGGAGCSVGPLVGGPVLAKQTPIGGVSPVSGGGLSPLCGVEKLEETGAPQVLGGTGTDFVASPPPVLGGGGGAGTCAGGPIRVGFAPPDVALEGSCGGGGAHPLSRMAAPPAGGVAGGSVPRGRSVGGRCLVSWGVTGG